ncbi:MAG: tauC [Frankiales bacterium]|nr:tauC [Frankiales bacterium]
MTLPRPLRRAIVPVAIVVLWQLGASTGHINTRNFSSPWGVLTAAGDLFRTGELQQHLLVSMTRAVVGLAIGGSLGLLMGIFAGLSRLGEDTIDSTIQAFRTLPYLGLVPLFILWFGIGESSRITMVALGSFFPIYLNVFKGIRNVDARFIDLAKGQHLNRWGLIRQVVVPGAMPQVLVGFRYAIGTAWLSLVIAEQVNATSGLGYLIVQATTLAQTSIIMTALSIYAVIGIIADGVVRLIERRALRWQRGFQGA